MTIQECWVSAYNTIQLLLVFEEQALEERSTLNAEKAPGGGGSGMRKHQKEEAPGGGSRSRKHQENAPRGDYNGMRLLEKALRREGSTRQRFREKDPVRECPRKKMLQEEGIQENGWRMLQAGLETQGWRGGFRCRRKSRFQDEEEDAPW